MAADGAEGVAAPWSDTRVVAKLNMMHDWILLYFQKGPINLPMLNCTYTFTVDPANEEYIFKTNFANFPKV